MIRASQAVVASDVTAIRTRRAAGDLKIHVLVGVLSVGMGFLLMLSSGLGSLLFIFGLGLLLVTRARMWWRRRT